MGILFLYIAIILRHFGNRLAGIFGRNNLYPMPILNSAMGGISIPEWPLLWMSFAAEDEGRTEEPTDRRRQKEREKGRVPKTQEIPAALVLIGGLLAIFFLSQYVLSGLSKMMKKYLGNFNAMPSLDTDSLTGLLISITYDTALIIGPIFIAVIFMAVVGNVLQVGFMFSLKPLEMDFSRIKFSFDNLIKRVFFSKNIAVNLIKTILKVFLMSWIAYFIIQMDFLTIIETGEISVAESLKILGFLGFKLTMIIAIILLIISVPDYFFQRYEFTESIKMTKQEIKEEYRESEGDPQVKQRQRQLAMELVRRSMMAEVRKADVVITNPTHFAVALRYDLTRENAPRVVAKGEDQIALIIRNIAKKEEIPVIENKPLAREIYRLVDVGDLVPVEFYDALAGIFITLSKYKTRLKNLSAGVGDA